MIENSKLQGGRLSVDIPPMADAKNHDLSLHDGKNDPIVADAILPQSGDFSLQNGKRIGLLGKIPFKTNEYSAGLGLRQLRQVPRG